MSHWIDSGEGYLSDMVSLRNDLLQGDLRSLYLAWLKAAPIYFDPESEDYIEPDVPANLNNLPNSLLVLIDFLELEQNLIAGAARASESQEEEEESLEDLIPKLSEREKNDFLVRLIKGESHVGMQLTNRLRELAGKREVRVNHNTPRRTLSELLKLAEGEINQRKKKEQEAASQEKIQKLESLAKHKDKIWEQVFAAIALKQSKPYDQAVAHLLDLRDLAEYQGKLAEFQASIQQMQKDYSNRPGLISRLQKVGLLGK